MRFVFALDIGTRKVAGLLAQYDDDVLNIIDVEVAEHSTRSMMDGQVHDVEGVARVVKRVKDALQERNEVELQEAAVAVAGRFLKTFVGEYEISLHNEVVDEAKLTELELGAISNATSQAPTEELYCVGYSVLQYTLDGLWIRNLLGHRAKKAGVSVVAAMLPAQVVDALIAVLERNEMKPSFMTLEPIAAMEVAIPEEMRILNVALVDIGAGTSDIAISKAGNVLGYGMVSIAGDEITESIAEKFLLDFHQAENVKRQIFSNQNEIEICDITGHDQTISFESALETCRPVVSSIAKEVAKIILDINKGKPSAVLLVGGGARVPSFVSAMAQELGIPQERVSLRSADDLKHVQDLTGKIQGSEFVTPVGIAYAAAKKTGSVFNTVFVNGKKVEVLRLNHKPTVMQVLIQLGYDLTQIMGRPKPAIVYELNGETKIHRRGFAGGSDVFVNGIKASLHDTIDNGAEVKVVSKSNDQTDDLRIRDIIKPVELILENSGEIIEFYPTVTVDGVKVSNYDLFVHDGNKIECKVTVDEIQEHLKERLGYVSYVINGERKSECRYTIHFSDENVTPGSKVKVSLRRKKIADILPPKKSIRITFNNREVNLDGVRDAVLIDDKYVDANIPLEEGMKITFHKSDFIVADALALEEIDISKVKDYTLKLNNKTAFFTDPLKDGDVVIFDTRVE